MSGEDRNATGNPINDAESQATRQKLAKGEVHIWRLRPEPDADLGDYSRQLGSDESERAARFLLPQLTHSYVVDHARMRRILGGYAGFEPEDLVFRVNKFGKPELENRGAERLRFNLSHTKGMTLLAVCLDADVGVDVEAVRLMSDLEDVAQSHFAPREIAALDALDPEEKQGAFFRCWTRKEAFLKAKGLGLSIPLDSFAVSLAAEARPALLECGWDPEETQRWSLFSLDSGPGFAAALAIKGGEWQVDWRDWGDT